MADPLRVDPELHIPSTNIIPSSNDQQKARKDNMRLWDPESESREWDQDKPQDWWFASTAIPLLAATLGPLANVLSIAALVTPWRSCLIIDVQPGAAAKACAWNGQGSTIGSQLKGQPFGDPVWAYSLNTLSLVTGCIGNIFLLCNFTKRIRYIIALPVTIAMWALSPAILIGITVAMHTYTPPIRPQQTYHQGFWYAVFAAVIYLICFLILLINMLGHILGHYPQTFALRDSHRTLILQTMLFFIWLAAGGAVFSTIESNYGGGSFEWTFVNALYFCEVTILTVGFGDIYPTNNFSRGLMLPYAVGGIVMLGLVVSSLTTFATELGSANIVKKHTEQARNKTIGRTVTNSTEYLDRQLSSSPGQQPHISAPFNPIDTSIATRISAEKTAAADHDSNRSPSSPNILQLHASS
jgi:potassium channel subfamily K